MKVQNFCKLFIGMGCLFLFSACQKDISSKKETSLSVSKASDKAGQLQKTNTFYGPQVQIGDGKARTFVTITHAGVPMEIGIEMTEGAITAPPGDHASFVLPFHQKAGAVTPFDHVYMGWNEGGHPPAFYLVPHFDIHFYMISNEERLAISTTSPLMEQVPPPPYWPQGFVPTPGGEPQMGKHWINPASPEICCGQPFTHTMIWGSYGGEFLFIEPMVTQAYLLSGQQVHTPFGQPAQVAVTGTYHPTSYNIYERDNKHYVSLSNFTWR